MVVVDDINIPISTDKNYFYQDEVCPNCGKGGCLMDLLDDDSLEFNATHTEKEIKEARQAVKDSN